MKTTKKQPAKPDPRPTLRTWRPATMDSEYEQFANRFMSGMCAHSKATGKTPHVCLLNLADFSIFAEIAKRRIGQHCEKREGIYWANIRIFVAPGDATMIFARNPEPI